MPERSSDPDIPSIRVSWRIELSLPRCFHTWRQGPKWNMAGSLPSGRITNQRLSSQTYPCRYTWAEPVVKSCSNFCLLSCFFAVFENYFHFFTVLSEVLVKLWKLFPIKVKNTFTIPILAQKIPFVNTFLWIFLFKIVCLNILNILYKFHNFLEFLKIIFIFSHFFIF